MSAPHGTRARYVTGCGCAPCKAANRTYENHRNRQALYGRPTTDLVDAEPVREHVRALIAAGMGTRTIAAAAGTTRQHVTALLNGRPHRGTPPTRRMDPARAAALLAVTAAPRLVCSDGSRRRIDALGAIGWTRTRLAARLGTTVQNLSWSLRRPQVTADTAEKIRVLYEELWNQPPTASSRFEQAGITRALARAEQLGHPPPVGWDDDLIDLPEAELKAEIDRRVAGMDEDELRRSRTARYSHGERSHVIVAAAAAWGRRARDRESA
ncbi:hypothetical protein [Nocardiopsis lucentensis]|uniref:hypothetical protein n=1 Tax=Nocardiopsis lucentensis TaxID=53441 RepID=UPI00034AE399|nr:hypothetical protein [Nocardiopsis lucentensis]